MSKARVSASPVESAKLSKPSSKAEHVATSIASVAEKFAGVLVGKPKEAAQAPVSAPPAAQPSPPPAKAVTAPVNPHGACWKVLEAKQVSIRGHITRLMAGDVVRESSYGPGIGPYLMAAGVKLEQLP